jgi:exodeoxyribonuclease VII large subunit
LRAIRRYSTRLPESQAYESVGFNNRKAFSMEEKKTVYTVSRLTREIRALLEESFSEIWVEGEVSNFKRYASGHLYFSLKDETGLINCVLFKNSALRLAFTPEDGINVLSRGRISVYDKRGQYQFYVSSMEPLGKGALQLAFEQLKEKLHKEGLFREEHKKALPALPMRVGVVTSASGAAIEDILNVARRRFANVEITIRPVRVQGDGAKTEIAAAIKEFNEYNSLIEKRKIRAHAIDVMIVGRGGGSLEDLWPFNEEVVARAIFGSAIPVISAVGHEVDYTIADFVADLRAPTPSAAAELVMPRKADLAEKIGGLVARTHSVLRNRVGLLEGKVEGLKNSYVLKTPLNVFAQLRQRVDDLTGSAAYAINNILELKTRDLATLSGKMQALSPLAVLERGYSITFKEGRALKDIADVSTGDIIETRLAKDSILSRVEQKERRK